MKLTEYEHDICIYCCYLILLELSNGGTCEFITEQYHRYNTMLNIFGFNDDKIILHYPDAAHLIEYAKENSLM